MTEMAYSFYELDDHQDLKRRGQDRRTRGRRPSLGASRVEMGNIPRRPGISMIMRGLRDTLRGGIRQLEEPLDSPTEVLEPDGMEVSLPPREVLQAIGSRACTLPPRQEEVLKQLRESLH